MRRQPPRSPLPPHTPLSRSLHRHGAVLHNVAERLIAPQPAAKEARFLSEDEYQRLLRACSHNSRDSAIIERSEEHTSELQSRQYLVCRLLLEKKKRRPHNID